jgi:hypothetical protein
MRETIPGLSSVPPGSSAAAGDPIAPSAFFATKIYLLRHIMSPTAAG